MINNSFIILLKGWWYGRISVLVSSSQQWLNIFKVLRFLNAWDHSTLICLLRSWIWIISVVWECVVACKYSVRILIFDSMLLLFIEMLIFILYYYFRKYLIATLNVLHIIALSTLLLLWHFINLSRLIVLMVHVLHCRVIRSIYAIKVNSVRIFIFESP